MSNDKFYQFLYDSFVCAFDATLDGGAIYICHADSEGLNFRLAMQESGWLMKQCLVWVKNSLVMGRQDYHWKHEPILYGWKPGAAHRWYGGRKRTTAIEDVAGVVCKKSDDGFVLSFTDGINSIDINVPNYEIINNGDDTTTTVWREEKPRRSGEHPTMKPVGLVAKGIKNSSVARDVVLDPFGGSGSTLIACEQLNRTCYMMELDPKYIDVIINRWEQFTGQKAVRLDG